MSLLDRIAAAFTPAASDQQRAAARAQLEQLAACEPFVQDILAQHRQIEALFAQARQQSGQAAQATVNELSMLLNAHFMAEEAVIYPEISNHSGKAHAAIAYEEHAMIKVQLAALQKLLPGSKDWGEKLDHVEGEVRRHVHQEEDSWLPDVVRYAPLDVRQTMSAAFRDYVERFDHS